MVVSTYLVKGFVVGHHKYLVLSLCRWVPGGPPPPSLPTPLALSPLPLNPGKCFPNSVLIYCTQYTQYTAVYTLMYVFTSSCTHMSWVCTMEELKWSGTGGSICVTPVVGIRCVHYIEEKDCTARFATGGI